MASILKSLVKDRPNVTSYACCPTLVRSVIAFDLLVYRRSLSFLSSLTIVNGKNKKLLSIVGVLLLDLNTFQKFDRFFIFKCYSC